MRKITAFVRRRFARGASLGFVAVVLGGCALPPAVEIASLVFGGGSFLVTGKGLGDHAISVAAGQDCSMLRPLTGDAICRPDGVGENWREALADGRLLGLEEIEKVASRIDYTPGNAVAFGNRRDADIFSTYEMELVAAELSIVETASGGFDELVKTWLDFEAVPPTDIALRQLAAISTAE